jgi:glutathione synthase/RimK-type ligase-like ATP-grasp enzyme
LAFQHKAGAVPKMMILSEETNFNEKEKAQMNYDHVSYRDDVDKTCEVPLCEMHRTLAVINLKIVNHNIIKNQDKGHLIYLMDTNGSRTPNRYCFCVHVYYLGFQ